MGSQNLAILYGGGKQLLSSIVTFCTREARYLLMSLRSMLAFISSREFSEQGIVISPELSSARPPVGERAFQSLFRRHD